MIYRLTYLWEVKWLEKKKRKQVDSCMCMSIKSIVCAWSRWTEHPYAASDGATGYEMRQLQQQNIRLRDTLVRLRDLSAHDKHEMQKLHKVGHFFVLWHLFIKLYVVRRVSNPQKRSWSQTPEFSQSASPRMDLLMIDIMHRSINYMGMGKWWGKPEVFSGGNGEM